MELTQIAAAAVLERANNALRRYSDKDWNYSRISLCIRALSDSHGPYILWPDLIDTRTKQGKADLKTAKDEITWGERHSNEMGILELISLRLNRALLEATDDEYWEHTRPIFRLTRTELLQQSGITEAFWYEVREVSGEDFDNR